MKSRIGTLALGVLLAAAGACGWSSEVPEGLSTFSVGPTGTPGPVEPATGSPRAVPAPAPPAGGGVPAGRNVNLGQPFRLRLGETVGIAGEDLVVGYTQFLSDNRCSPGLQCLVRGNARIVVTVGSDTTPQARFNLNTDEAPRRIEYLTYSVELVDLARGARPEATLRVTE